MLLDNQGTVTLKGTLRVGDGDISNSGLIDIQSGLGILWDLTGAVPSLSNSGTLRSSSASTWVSVATFTNTGALEVQSGRLILQAAHQGTSTNTTTVETNGTMWFGDGNWPDSVVGADPRAVYDFASVTGAGQVVVTQGGVQATFSGVYDVAGATTVDLGNSAEFTGTVQNLGQTVTIGGTATFHGQTLSIPNLTINGLLTGVRDLTVTDSLNLTGPGHITGSGTLLIPHGAALNGGGRITGMLLDNQGTVTLTRTLNLSDGDARNSGLFEIRSGSGLLWAETGRAPDFTNTGTVRVSIASQFTTWIGVRNFTNTGTIEVQSGSLRLLTTEQGISTGTTVVDTNGRMIFSDWGARSQRTDDDGAGPQAHYDFAHVSGAGQVFTESGAQATFSGLYDITGATTVDHGSTTITPSTLPTRPCRAMTWPSAAPPATTRLSSLPARPRARSR